MKRTLAAGILVVSAVVLAGCSGSDAPSADAGSSASAGSEGAATGGEAAAQGEGRTKAAGESAVAPALTRKLAKTSEASSYAFRNGSAAARSRFDDATEPLKSLVKNVKVVSAYQGGAARADVAVVTFAGADRDARFEGQIVSQLVGQSAGSTRLTYQDLDGKAAAVAKARPSSVGWFAGDKAVIVLARPGGTAAGSLAVASDVAHAYSE